MKQKLFTNRTSITEDDGFTIIELLVVLGIMAIVATMFLVNFANLRGPRNLKIAQNELVSNFRKIQSYTLSARNAPTGVVAKYYMLTVNTSATSSSNTRYTIDVIDRNNATSTLESVSLPQGVVIDSMTATTTTGTLVSPVNCAQVAFNLPFGTIYVDYSQATTACSVNVATKSLNPTQLASMANTRLDIKLRDRASNRTAIVEVNGIAGTITSR